MTEPAYAPTELQRLYDRHGISTKDLGCIMLDVTGPATELYKQVPDVLWATGPELEPHVTLRYGFLESAQNMKDAAEELLERWERPKFLQVSEVFVINRTEEYDCVVVGFAAASAMCLDAANKMLAKLPNIATFIPYHPHMTIGYVLPGTGHFVCEALNAYLSNPKNTSGPGERPDRLRAGELNFGDPDKAKSVRFTPSNGLTLNIAPAVPAFGREALEHVLGPTGMKVTD